METNSPDGSSGNDFYEIPFACNPEKGDTIDQYRIEKRLGEGAFGSVFKVTDRRNGQVKALKLLNLFKIPYEEERKGILQRFRMEYDTGKIASEYLVHSWDFGKTCGNPYIVMDFCAGGDIRAVIGKNTPYETVKRWAHEVLMGLNDLHSNGKVHRDLKPDNVLLTTDQKARLTDFGISGHKSMRMTRRNIFNKPTEIFGTIAYMPPEQLNPTDMHVTVLPTIDIFAFGTMFYEVFSGHFPFGPLETDADLANYNRNVKEGRIIDIKKYNCRLPSEWDTIFNKSLQPNYKNRFQSTDEILSLLGKPVENRNISFNFYKDKLSLLIMQGEEYGRPYRLSDLCIDEEGVIKIGRADPDARNIVEIKEETTTYISRQHSTIEKTSGNSPGYYILDGQWNNAMRQWKPSLNGTFVNAEKLYAGERRMLCPDDIITIGDVTLKVVKNDTQRRNNLNTDY
ncbi:MAG: FHA domain-containing serine/threonine-protein kinase [Bacteroidota bacterium]